MFANRRLFLGFFLLMLFAAPAAALAAEAPTTISGQGVLDLVAGEGKGKVVLLNVFASWCPPCREEIPQLIELRKSWSEDDILLIGVSVDDSMADFRRFSRLAKFNYPVYLGNENFIRQFDVGAIPQLVIFDRTGKMVFNDVGLMEKEDLVELVEQYR